MIIKNIFTIFLIIINFVLIVLVINRISKENFDIFKFASDSIVNLDNLKLGPKEEGAVSAIKCDETEDPSCAMLPKTSADNKPDDCVNGVYPGIKNLCSITCETIKDKDEGNVEGSFCEGWYKEDCAFELISKSCPKMCAKLNKNLCKAIVDTDLLPKSNQPNIYVGGKEDLPINTSVNIGTNNTIFIRENPVGNTGIKITTGDCSEGDATTCNSKTYDLNLKALKEMKYLPYNFKDKICIGNSCVDKLNLKMLKGNVGFTLNTYTLPKPFQLFSEINFNGWTEIYNTDSVSNINLQNLGAKSFKILDTNYTMTVSEGLNHTGEKMDYDVSEMADVTATFPDGFKSFQPKSKHGDLLTDSCLSLQTVIHAPAGDNEVIQATPCNIAADTFYIARDDITKEHTHPLEGEESKEEVHFHEHNQSETYHYEETDSGSGKSKLPSGKCIPESVSADAAIKWAEDGCESGKAILENRSVWFNAVNEYNTTEGYYKEYNEDDTLPDDQEPIQLCPGSLYRCA
jgi:hypothetical protein